MTAQPQAQVFSEHLPASAEWSEGGQGFLEGLEDAHPAPPGDFAAGGKGPGRGRVEVKAKPEVYPDSGWALATAISDGGRRRTLCLSCPAWHPR